MQPGWARSGKILVSDYYAESDCAPDILTTAKSIAGGLPLSAVCASTKIMDGITPGIIGGTYCGNPLACASALALIDVMEREDYPAKAQHIANTCMTRFSSWLDRFEVVGDARGIGAMMGIEFVTDKKSKAANAEIVSAIVNAATERGLLLEAAGTYNNVIRFLCPLCVTDVQLACCLDIFEQCIEACMEK